MDDDNKMPPLVKVGIFQLILICLQAPLSGLLETNDKNFGLIMGLTFGGMFTLLYLFWLGRHSLGPEPEDDGIEVVEQHPTSCATAGQWYVDKVECCE